MAIWCGRVAGWVKKAGSQQIFRTFARTLSTCMLFPHAMEPHKTTESPRVAKSQSKKYRFPPPAVE